MKRREFQLEELERARYLQGELAKLHIPSPVLSWSYDIKSADGMVSEKGIGKSNSFTRNALNIIAHNVGCTPWSIYSAYSVGDKYINTKNTAGTISNTALYRYSGSSTPSVIVGISTGAESLDSYEEPTYTGLTLGPQADLAVFDSTRRVLTTVLTRVFTNGTASNIDITEAGILMGLTSAGSTALMVRDVFSAVSLAPAKIISWSYTIEVAYPNP